MNQSLLGMPATVHYSLGTYDDPGFHHLPSDFEMFKFYLLVTTNGQ